MKEARLISVPLARAVMYCQQGRYTEVAPLRPRYKSATQRKLVRHETRALELVRALALIATGDEVGAEAALARAKPAFTGEYEYLAANWPPLQELLVHAGMRAA